MLMYLTHPNPFALTSKDVQAFSLLCRVFILNTFETESRNLSTERKAQQRYLILFQSPPQLRKSVTCRHRPAGDVSILDTYLISRGDR